MENFSGLGPTAVPNNHGISPVQQDIFYETVDVLTNLARRHLDQAGETDDWSDVPGIRMDDAQADNEGGSFFYVLDDTICDILQIPHNSLIVITVRFTGPNTSDFVSAGIISSDESETRPASSRSVEELQQQLTDLKRYAASLH